MIGSSYEWLSLCFGTQIPLIVFDKLAMTGSIAAWRSRNHIRSTGILRTLYGSSDLTHE